METLLFFAMVTLLARVGLAMYATGLSRSKNSTSAVARAVCDLCLTVLAFWAVGAAVLWQMNGPVIGCNVAFLLGGSVDPSRFVFQVAAFMTAGGVVLAATAERARFGPLAVVSILLSALIFPVLCNWVWFGWLRQLGFIDIGGAASLHVVAAIFGLVAALVVGPRTGKFNRDGSSTMIPGHNLPLASVGMLLMQIGWIGYIAGSALLHEVPSSTELRPPFAIASLAAADALLAAAAAGAGGLLYSFWRYRKPDIMLMLGGMLGGLVAISAAAGVASTRSAVLIGLVAGLLAPASTMALEQILRVDDAIGLVAAHGIGGAWGTIAVAFCAPIAFASKLRLLALQTLGLLSIAVVAGLLALLIFGALKATMRIRCREADEWDGLDLAEHDIGSYPDFHQNMIKSYHLRET